MNRAHVFARSAIASGSALLVLLVGQSAAGCATAGDPLRTAVLTNNVASAALNAARKQHEEALAADMRARFARCPESSQAARQACVHDEAIAAMAAVAAEREALGYLALVEGETANALEAAGQCRVAQTSCEADFLRTAEHTLAVVQAGLARRALDAGAGGSP